MATKVSSVSATIADLESKRIFSPFNAPKLQTMKSYQITDAQAREFVQIDYLSENKNQTRPARPVWSIAPRRLMAHPVLETTTSR